MMKNNPDQLLQALCEKRVAHFAIDVQYSMADTPNDFNFWKVLKHIAEFTHALDDYVLNVNVLLDPLEAIPFNTRNLDEAIEYFEEEELLPPGQQSASVVFYDPIAFKVYDQPSADHSFFYPMIIDLADQNFRNKHVLFKSGTSAFREPRENHLVASDFLDQNKKDTLVITGGNTWMCVAHTIQDALEMEKYQICVITDMLYPKLSPDFMEPAEAWEKKYPGRVDYYTSHEIMALTSQLNSHLKPSDLTRRPVT